MKITDCLGENSETQVWLDFARHYSYINKETYSEAIALNEEITKLLMYMYNNPYKFGVKKNEIVWSEKFRVKSDKPLKTPNSKL